MSYATSSKELAKELEQLQPYNQGDIGVIYKASDEDDNVRYFLWYQQDAY